MKKILKVFIFIFLAGLFSGVFYSTGLSAENTDRLSELILSASASPPSGFIHSLLSFFRVNMLMLLLMLPAVFTKYLCPVPPLLLWYRCFSAGFCSGIIYIRDPGHALMVSLVKIIPQNIFFIPAFIMFAAVTFTYSVSGTFTQKRNRVTLPPGTLKLSSAAAFAAVCAGSITGALLSQISV